MPPPLMAWGDFPGHAVWPSLEVRTVRRADFLCLPKRGVPSWVLPRVYCRGKAGSARRELSHEAL